MPYVTIETTQDKTKKKKTRKAFNGESKGAQALQSRGHVRRVSMMGKARR